MKIENYENLINQIEKELSSNFTSEIKTWSIERLIDNFRSEQNKPKEFINWVCELSGCDPYELKTRKRTIEIVRARKLISVGMVHIFKMSATDAGIETNKDHTHYYGSFKAMKNDYEYNKEYKKIFADLFYKYPEMLIEKKKRKYVIKHTE